MCTFWWGYFHVFDGGMFVSDPRGGVTWYPVQLPYYFSRSSTYSELRITSGLTSFPRDCGLVFIIGPSKQRFRKTNIWWSFPKGTSDPAHLFLKLLATLHRPLDPSSSIQHTWALVTLALWTSSSSVLAPVILKFEEIAQILLQSTGFLLYFSTWYFFSSGQVISSS